jgi:hypothetical protein
MSCARRLLVVLTYSDSVQVCPECDGNILITGDAVKVPVDEHRGRAPD